MVPVVHVSIAPPTILTCRYAERMSGVPDIPHAHTHGIPHPPHPLPNWHEFLVA